MNVTYVIMGEFALKRGIRTRLLFINRASHVATTKSLSPEAWGWGFLWGSCIPLWLWSTRPWPAVSAGREPDHGDTVNLQEFIYLPFHIKPSFFLLKTGQRITRKSSSRVCNFLIMCVDVCYSKKNKRKLSFTQNIYVFVGFVNVLYLKQNMH